MPNLKLDILVVPTFNVLTLGIADSSVYPTSPEVTAPTIEITIPGFSTVVLPFSTDNFTVYTSSTLGITEIGDPYLPLPDGVYLLKYSVAPAYINFVEKSIIRVDQLQEKFDTAFMKLDMMECSGPIQKQAKVDLTSIYFFIQGAIAAANNCAVDEANKLYHQANNMLCSFIKNNCGCNGSNFLKTFN